MATTMNNHTNMAIGHDNRIVKAYVSNIALTNITTASGSSTENLLTESPAVQWVSGSPTGDPIITFTMSTPMNSTHLYFGIVNARNILRGYDTLYVEYSANGSTGWTDFGHVDLMSSALAALTTSDDHDFLWKLNAGTSSITYWRVRLTRASGIRPAISVGNFFYGQGYELPKNPRMFGGTNWDFESATTYIRSPGGHTHLARGNDIWYATGSYDWEWVSIGQALLLRDLVWSNASRLVGIIDPDQATQAMPLQWGHRYVKGLRIHMDPVPGYTSTSPQYNMRMDCIGAY